MPSTCYSLPGVIRSQYKRRGVIATLTLTLLCRLRVLLAGWICRISGGFLALRSRNAEAEGVPAATAEHWDRANRLSAASSEPAGVCGSALGPELCLVVCGGGDWCWWCSPPLL